MEGHDEYNEMDVWDGSNTLHPRLEHATTTSPSNNVLYSSENHLYIRAEAKIGTGPPATFTATLSILGTWDFYHQPSVF